LPVIPASGIDTKLTKLNANDVFMQPYLNALNAMHELLEALEEHHWRKWIAQDIRDWESQKTVQHHLSAYGGMGSINDIGFEDVWLGTLFEDLRSVCYHFAHQPIAKPNVSSLEHDMGSVGFELSGWRCLLCGYGTVSHKSIDRFIARRVIRRLVLSEASGGRLQELVHSVVKSHPSDAVFTYDGVVSRVKASGLNIRDNDDWLRPCPSCGSNDTAVFRWLLSTKTGLIQLLKSNRDEGLFVPAPDNLPLRKKTS
jgi:hypothetical protein